MVAMLSALDTLRVSVAGGDDAAARAAWVDARLAFVRIEPLLARADEDATRELSGEGEDPGAFHRVEAKLFVRGAPWTHDLAARSALTADVENLGADANAAAHALRFMNLDRATVRNAWTSFHPTLLVRSDGQESAFSGTSILEWAATLDAMDRDLGDVAGVPRTAAIRRALGAALEEAMTGPRYGEYTPEIRVPADRLHAPPPVAGPDRVWNGIPREPLRSAIDRTFDALEAAAMKGTPNRPPPGPAPAQVSLGRLIFFDPILSANGERSCASCHAPAKALGDGCRTAVAIDHGALERNTPSLVNVADHRAFFWDGRAPSLAVQADEPIHNARELGGLSDHEIEGRLGAIAEYRALFRRAFGTERPRYRDAVLAVAAFERTLRSRGSTVDRWWDGTGPEPDAEVRAGFDLFAGKARCARCHYLPLTTSVEPGPIAQQEFLTTGVPADSTGRALDPDPGRYAVTRAARDMHAFKAPSLRGVARTAPYMHNGAFSTLAQVVRFYNEGGGRGLGLDVPNQATEVRPLHLTEREEVELVRFLEALSDDPAAVARAPARVPSGLPVGGKY